MAFKKLLRQRLLLGTCFIGGFLIALLFFRNDAIDSVESVREGDERYQFINPLLFTKSSEETTKPQYVALKKSIEGYIEPLVADGIIRESSVYVRNLNSGEWISVNPEETFNPASMLKVVTLISVLRKAESDPSLLRKEVFLTGDDTPLVEIQAHYPVEDPIRAGRKYSVEELINHLIIESDNVANTALNNLIGDEIVRKTYEDLKLPFVDLEEGKGLTTEEYSHLFRALYNSTYLSRPLSEHVLDLLSKTKFTKGLTVGLPQGTVVSHKFGVWAVLSDQSTEANRIIAYRELHDCGIVYYPQNPYFICIMTRGDDFDTLETVIQTVSHIVWEKFGELKSARSS